MLVSLDQPSTKPSQTEGIAGLLKTVSILRIGSGIVLAAFHAWGGVIGGYEFVWKEKPWDWVKTLTDAHVPMPHIAAPMAAALIAAVAVSWIAGFVTRLFAFIALPLGIGALVVAGRLGLPHVECCWLYLLIAVTLLLFGSGNISVDWFFNLGNRPKQKKPQHKW